VDPLVGEDGQLGMAVLADGAGLAMEMIAGLANIGEHLEHSQTLEQLQGSSETDSLDC